ncbi:MAG: hypothetical protein GXP55_15440 [Deltaproteobacteria bacterium]|nr:hypothetical protein [Deltaproteobacteria bacterium]
MNAPARRFWELLELEREAARRADLDTLIELQAQKKLLVEAMGDQGIELEERDALAETAAENIELLRHLVALFGAIAGVGASTYGRGGVAREDAGLQITRARG